MDTVQRQNTLLSGIEPKIPSVLTHQNKNMNGPGLSMKMLKNKSHFFQPKPLGKKVITTTFLDANIHVW